MRWEFRSQMSNSKRQMLLAQKEVNLGSHKRHFTDVLSSNYILLNYYYIITIHCYYITYHSTFMVPEAQNFFALKEDSPEAPCPGLVKQLACTHELTAA